MSCGEHHTVCVTDDGSVYSWGRGKLGALGHGSTEDLTMPKRIEVLSNAVKVHCGTDYTIVMDNKGKLYSFGDNSYGQLGINKDSVRFTEP